MYISLWSAHLGIFISFPDSYNHALIGCVDNFCFFLSIFNKTKRLDSNAIIIPNGNSRLKKKKKIYMIVILEWADQNTCSSILLYAVANETMDLCFTHKSDRNSFSTENTSRRRSSVLSFSLYLVNFSLASSLSPPSRFCSHSLVYFSSTAR